MSIGKRGCLAPPALLRWFCMKPLLHFRALLFKKKRMQSECAIRSDWPGFLAEGSRLSRVAFWATGAALDSLLPGAILVRIGWPTVPHCRGPLTSLVHPFITRLPFALGGALNLDSVHADVRDVLGLQSTKRALSRPKPAVPSHETQSPGQGDAGNERDRTFSPRQPPFDQPEVSFL